MNRDRQLPMGIGSANASMLRTAVRFRQASNWSTLIRFTPMQLWPAWLYLFSMLSRRWIRFRNRFATGAAGFGANRHPRSRRRRWTVGGLILLVGLACGSVAEFKYYIWPKRFRVVESGQIYRGGWQTPIVLRRILREYHINTLLNVACNPTEPEAAGEGTVVREAGVEWHKILMPGTGLATLGQLDEAADLLADPARRPIFIHCAAGVHRTNMSIAAFRLKHCGWTLAAAIDEMVKNGYDYENDRDKEKLLLAYIEQLRAARPAIVQVTQ